MRFAEHSVNIVLSTTLCDAGIDLSSMTTQIMNSRCKLLLELSSLCTSVAHPRFQHMTNQIMNTPVANYCLNYLVHARV